MDDLNNQTLSVTIGEASIIYFITLISAAVGTYQEIKRKNIIGLLCQLEEN